VYSSRASIAHAVDERAGIYYSRARDELWRKGATSGHTQRLLRVDPDCDRDAARFIVQQQGGEAPGCGAFCHLETRSCFGAGAGVGELARTLARRLATAEEGSYTRRLAEDPELLRAKLHEEADELCDAGDAGHAAQETADLLYFALARAAAAGVSLADVERVLDVRARRVTRRSAVEANSTAPRGSAPAAADVVNDRAEGSA
jgi:phosphoribosyl-ATP pyrophosphohydrolase